MRKHLLFGNKLIAASILSKPTLTSSVLACLLYRMGRSTIWCAITRPEKSKRTKGVVLSSYWRFLEIKTFDRGESPSHKWKSNSRVSANSNLGKPCQNVTAWRRWCFKRKWVGIRWIFGDDRSQIILLQGCWHVFVKIFWTIVQIG